MARVLALVLRWTHAYKLPCLSIELNYDLFSLDALSRIHINKETTHGGIED
jgi:hypothetical protein